MTDRFEIPEPLRTELVDRMARAIDPLAFSDHETPGPRGFELSSGRIDIQEKRRKRAIKQARAAIDAIEPDIGELARAAGIGERRSRAGLFESPITGDQYCVECGRISGEHHPDCPFAPLVKWRKS